MFVTFFFLEKPPRDTYISTDTYIMHTYVRHVRGMLFFTCSHPPTFTQEEKTETEPSWFLLLTQMKWDYITRNGRNSRFCLELGTNGKDAGEKWFKTDLDSVNELTREQCVTTHMLHLNKTDQIHKNIQYKWLK